MVALLALETTLRDHILWNALPHKLYVDQTMWPLYLD